MGIYIKGMKKPSDCQYCVMYRDGYCGAKGGFCRSEKGVDADCPIVEVVEVNESEIPTSSEKPNNCETCKHNKLEWFSEICDGCSKANSHYEPKDEPQKCYLRESCDHYGDKQVCGRCRHYNLYSHTKTEPQTDIEIARAIVHKAIDDTPIAEDAYPDLRQKMHDAVDNYEPQTDCAWKKGE